jgi:predicted aspartyl protease
MSRGARPRDGGIREELRLDGALRMAWFFEGTGAQLSRAVPEPVKKYLLASVAALSLGGPADAALSAAKAEMAAEQLRDTTQSKQTGKRIPLRLSRNSYIVPVLINGRIWLDFILDTGADDVSIPDDVAKTLVRARTITKEDIGSEKKIGLADGRTANSTQLRIRSLQVGEGDNAVIAQNVAGGTSGPQGELLLGQSFLRRFRSTTIDHVNSVLIIDGSDLKSPVPTALQPAPAPAPVLRPAHPASVQQGPILPPPVPQFHCYDPPPGIRALGAVLDVAGGGAFSASYQRACLRRYNIAMQQWRAEVQRIQTLNQQRGY